MFEFLKKHKLPVALLGVFLIVAVPVMSAFYDTTFTNALQKGFIDVVSSTSLSLRMCRMRRTRQLEGFMPIRTVYIGRVMRG
jgi:hypothetical protein